MLGDNDMTSDTELLVVADTFMSMRTQYVVLRMLRQHWLVATCIQRANTTVLLLLCANGFSYL